MFGRLINRAVDALPFEAHIPGYQFCGPGTRLAKRLARGDEGVNSLDQACRTHDIAYHRHKDDEERKIADEVLSKRAWERVMSNDASLGERAAALGVAGVMKLKSKLGGGVKKLRTVDVKNRRGTKRLRDVNVLWNTLKAKAALRSKATLFRQHTASSMRHAQTDTTIPPRNVTPEENLKMEVEKARTSVRQKLKALQLHTLSRDRFLDTYLTKPMKRALDKSTENKPSKQEVVDASLDTSTPSTQPSSTLREAEISPETSVSTFERDGTRDEGDVHSRWNHFIKSLRKGESDKVYGPRLVDNDLFIGNSRVVINDDGSFTVGERTYQPTKGLLKLVFARKADNPIPTENDMTNYKRILTNTNAHLVGYKGDSMLNVTKRWKFLKIIQHMFPETSPTTKKVKAKMGRGLRFVTTPYYKFWRDPNDLVQRLRLLHASKSAGNTAHDAEIVEIEGELRNAGIII